MAIKVNFNGASIAKPGAYSQTRVNLAGGFPLATTGIVAIVGEALGGEPGSSAGVQTFTSEDIASLIDTYISGPIVDAARLLVAPARDARVPNGASLIRIYKTNASTRSSKVLKNAASVNLMNLSSANFGEAQNLIQVRVVAGSNPNARIVTFKKGSLTEVMSENPRDEMLNIAYTGAGSAATLEIKKVSGVKTLVTTCTGAAGDNLSISLLNKTVQDLVDLITPNAAYTVATTFRYAASTPASDLDWHMATLDIKTAANSLFKEQKELMDIINAQSNLVTASLIDEIDGQVAASSYSFFSGAARGASTNTNFQNAFDALLASRCNTVVPLISRDASALAALGLTDPSSSFDIDSVNLQAVTHCITASNTKNRSERNCYASIKDTFANSQNAARDLNSERASMLFQDVEVLDSTGNLSWQDPWAASCMLAGIQAGTEVGTPATFKVINANGIRHSDYNSKTQVDLAIDAGLLPLEERDSGGFRVVVHNSSYSTDANFVYNRPSVLYSADYVAYNLRQQLEAIYVGEKARPATAKMIKATVVALMRSFLEAEIIVGDDSNGGTGFKDLLVTIVGNTATVEITITPVQGIDFVLNKITLDNIRMSA